MAPPLPRLYLITPQPGPDDDVFVARLRLSLERLAALPAPAAGGPLVPLVQFRAYGLPPARWRALAVRVRQACHARGVRLLLGAGALAATPPQGATTAEGLAGALAGVLATAMRDTGADGVHLPSSWLAAASIRPVPADALLAASCHDAAQLAQARRVGADLVTLSPVLPTASHPGAATLGWREFARLCEAAAMPVYALGGVGPGEWPLALAAGAQGVAGIRALWATDDAAGAPEGGRAGA